MSREITVYGKKGCRDCDFTTDFFKKRNVPFVKVDIEEDEDARKLIDSKGVRSLPYVVVHSSPEQTWVGFRLDMLMSMLSR